jgi:hypothetical protein
MVMSDSSRERGRFIVLVIIIVNLLVSIGLTIFIAFYYSPMVLLHHAIHLILYIILAVFMYRGLPWARWVAAVLLVVSGITTLGATIALALYLVAPVFLLPSAVVSVVNIISAVVLLTSRSVKAHFRKQGESDQ